MYAIPAGVVVVGAGSVVGAKTNYIRDALKVYTVIRTLKGETTHNNKSFQLLLN